MTQEQKRDIIRDAAAMIVFMAPTATDADRKEALKMLVGRAVHYTEEASLDFLCAAVLTLCKRGGVKLDSEQSRQIDANVRRTWRLCYAQLAGGRLAVEQCVERGVPIYGG